MFIQESINKLNELRNVKCYLWNTINYIVNFVNEELKNAAVCFEQAQLTESFIADIEKGDMFGKSMRGEISLCEELSVICIYQDLVKAELEKVGIEITFVDESLCIYTYNPVAGSVLFESYQKSYTAYTTLYGDTFNYRLLANEIEAEVSQLTLANLLEYDFCRVEVFFTPQKHISKRLTDYLESMGIKVSEVSTHEFCTHRAILSIEIGDD